MRLAHVAALASAALIACSKRPTPSADAGAVTAPPADAAPRTPGPLSRAEGEALVKNACLSCHSEDMLEQQRLTLAQWTKEVTKMVGWGANLDPIDTAPLTSWLAATYGPDAGLYEASVISAADASAKLAALPDGPFANGDPERGRAIYTDRCSGCHGPDARGHIGVLLVDRPFLYRAQDVAETIRHGRGKMIPIPMSDSEIGDVLAHLRRLKNPNAS